MRPQTITRGVSENLTANAFSIEDTETHGYRFLKWNTEPDGSGTNYTDGASVKNLAPAGEKITLYAQWEEYSFADVTIAFADEGASRVNLVSEYYGSQRITESGQTVKLASGKTYVLSVDLAPNHDFASWSVNSGTIGSPITNPTTYIPNAAATLTVTTRQRFEKLYLQDVTIMSCPIVATIAYDNRDENEYIIKRLDDGKCWMMDNLRLGSASETAELTPSNTNISSNEIGFTLPASGKITNNYTSPQLNASSVNNISTSMGDGSGKIGVYYNFCAASAGTLCTNNSLSNVTSDICPKGWSLPSGGNSGGDIVNLHAAYNNKYTATLTAFSANMSGYINSGSGNVLNLGSNGYFWTSTGYNLNKSYILETKSSWLGFSGGGVRSNGLSIRCRLK